MKTARQQIIEQTIDNSNRLSRDMVRTCLLYTSDAADE